LSGRRWVSTDESHCRDNKNQEKRFIALFRIYQRIMGEQRKICVECQVPKKKKENKREKKGE